MTCKDCFLTINVLTDVPGFKAGTSVRVQSNGGTPTSKFWRDRLRDAKIDHCVSIQPAPKKPKNPLPKKVRQNDPS